MQKYFTKYCYFLLLLLFTTSAKAQRLNVDSIITILKYNLNDTTKVRSLIKLSKIPENEKYLIAAFKSVCESNELKNNSRIWQYRGYLYKELYNLKEANNHINPQYRDEAVQFYLKAFQLIENNSSQRKNIIASLKFIGSKYNQDANKCQVNGNIKMMEINYKKFRNIFSAIDEKFDSIKWNKEFMRF